MPSHTVLGHSHGLTENVELAVDAQGRKPRELYGPVVPLGGTAERAWLQGP